MADRPDDGTPGYSYNDTTCLATPSDNCSKLNIAKAAIFSILDNNGDGMIDSSDMSSLNIRIGFMHYTGQSGTYGNVCDEAGCNGQASCRPNGPAIFDYNNGCNQLVYGIDNGTSNGTTYSKIYCGSNTSCSSVSASGSGASVRTASASGGTPLAGALTEALSYLTDNKTADTSASSCRQKYAVIITDGEDTYACFGDGTAGQSNMNMRRAAVVTRAKALADAGYKVFVIGFGSTQTSNLINTLNWAAYWGGTDNPSVNDTWKTGNPNGYTPPAVGSECSPSVADPGSVALTGYAFIATSTADLTNGLKAVINKIKEGAYSFSQPYIAASRTSDEDYIYQASFEPQVQPNDPLWIGHLDRYSVTNTGVVSTVADWDAGQKLQGTAASSRSINTYVGGTLINFVSAPSLTPSMLGLASSDTGNLAMIRSFISGGDANPTSGNVKLGDIFDSNLAVLGTPTQSFTDTLDLNNAFALFRTNHPRTTPNNTRIIVAGANDGQLHAFRTGTGDEAWSIIPPNALPSLRLIAHATHPTNLTHTFMVDGPVTTSDAWLCSGSCDYTHKQTTDWHSLIVFGLGKGSQNQLWGSNAKCDGNSTFSGTYDSTTFKYYCGYYALDATTNPSSQIDSLKWTIKTDTAASYAPYLGQPWSKMSIGRVKINGQEKWVGFIGGGYNPSSGTCSNPSTCAGKGIFVIDLLDGTIIKAFTQANYSNMIYSFPAAPAKIDTDYDGFVDRIYIGDLGGNMWRLQLCKQADGSTCNANSWSAAKLYDASADTPLRPIFTKPITSIDTSGNLWVYWGTGDTQNPTDSTKSGQFYGLKDGGNTYAYSDLQTISSSSTFSGTKQGWRLPMAGTGEKILGDPDIYGGIVYFTSFTPAGATLCSTSGVAQLYSVSFVSGSSNSTTLSGAGIASGVMISTGPTGITSIFYGVSGAGSASGGVGNAGNITSTLGAPNLRYWRDRRAQ